MTEKTRDAILLAYARVWPAGKSPYAPGTCGSFAAILLAPILFMPLPLWGRALALLLVLATGTLAAGRAEELTGKKDPGEVVIDEVLGQWIVLFPFTSLAVWEYAVAFAFFRLFDITKPWPVKRLEQVGGGLGIMIDDAAAGVYALICMMLVRCIVY